MLRYPYPRKVDELERFDQVEFHAESSTSSSKRQPVLSIASREGFLIKQGKNRKVGDVGRCSLFQRILTAAVFRHRADIISSCVFVFPFSSCRTGRSDGSCWSVRHSATTRNAA